MESTQSEDAPRRRIAMGRGGWRPNSGRKEGSGNAMSRAAREAARATGMLPHEILLDMARGNPQVVRKVVGKDGEGELRVEEHYVELTLDDRKDAAKAAAPYYAPKLSSVETVAGIGDDDLDELIKQFAAQAGFGAIAGGAGEEEQEAHGAGGGESHTARRRVPID